MAKLFEKANEAFMVRVCWMDSMSRMHGEVTADTGYAIPDPPPTSAEMQAVAFAAKMAMAKVLKERKRRKRDQACPSAIAEAACTGGRLPGESKGT